MPIAVLAIAASAAGILLESVYTKETDNWAGQAVGQDVANLIAYPALLLLALAAGRGSLRAYLAWTGVLAYSVYAYAIYAFSVHFGPLFLVYVAVFGLSIYALVGGLASIDPERVKESFTSRTPLRTASTVLIAIGAVFYLLWLSEVIPATLGNATPQSLVEAGLPTNPVHVLDMAVLLPATMLAGVLLTKRREWGYCLAPLLLGSLALLGLGIVAAMAVLAIRREAASWGVAIAVGAITGIEVLVLARFLRAIDRDDLRAVLRPPKDST
ncbi:MAG: hypothetical protein ACRDVL_02515 [Acidimicrobiia bacterium]